MSYVGEIKPGYALCNPLSTDTPAQPFNIMTLGSSHLGFDATGTWLEQIIPLTTSVSQFSSLWEANIVNSGAGGFGVLGGARTSDGITATANVFGVGGFAICDAPSTGPFSKLGWAGYFETRRMAGASYAITVESDILNFGATVPIDPYDIVPDGLSANLWLASGRSDATGAGGTTASAAIGIINNGQTFDKGIVFHATALQGNDGVTGIAGAICMPKGDAIVWYEPDTETPIAQIRSDTPDAATAGTGIVFADDQLRIDSFDSSMTYLRIDGAANAVNYIITQPGAVGVSAAILTNAGDLVLAPVGNVRFGVHGAIGAETVTGYITIKDFAGTLRKIAVVS